MGMVRLGRMYLRWCDQCNVPVLEDDECGICGERTRNVEVTPPGDIRPAFQHDIDHVRDIVDRQFGKGTGPLLLPDSKIVLMNKVPALDRMDEIIVDGEVVASLRYDIGIGWKVLLRIEGATKLIDRVSRATVIADRGAVAPILNSSNLMAPGVKDVIGDVEAGDETIILDPEGEVIATGVSRMSREQMLQSGRGAAVKVRWASRPRPFEIRGSSDWDKVLRANRNVLDRREREAIDFIKRLCIEYERMPQIVSFSGGKDSLACLLLTRRADLNLPVFFIDTGLEFEETVRYVHDLAEGMGLTLIEGKAEENAFHGNLPFFGPPGKDYRWCCKTNKLGPTSKTIVERFPNGMLSFIGQRRYESENRASKPKVWRNPWTPGQIGASPIQDWTALHVWLYIFREKADYNPWYERGLDRIGCFLCPASDLAELETVKENCSAMTDWQEFLTRYAEDRGHPRDWVRFGLWRWRKVPGSIIEELKRNVPDLDLTISEKARIEEGVLRLRMQEGFSPCTLGLSIEGAFSRDLHLEAVANILNMVGEVERSSDGWCSVENITVFREGALIAKGKDQSSIKEKVERVRRAVVKAEECVGCGVCIARCKEGALVLIEGVVRIDEQACIHCGCCMEPCPAISFGDTIFDF